MHEAEQQVIGASHAQIGAYLLGIWGVPYPVVEAVAHHHAPESAPSGEFDVLAVLAVAHALTPEDDATAFGGSLVHDAQVGSDYLKSRSAPFDWSEAVLRAAGVADP